MYVFELMWAPMSASRAVRLSSFPAVTGMTMVSACPAPRGVAVTAASAACLRCPLVGALSVMSCCMSPQPLSSASDRDGTVAQGIRFARRVNHPAGHVPVVHRAWSRDLDFPEFGQWISALVVRGKNVWLAVDPVRRRLSLRRTAKSGWMSRPNEPTPSKGKIAMSINVVASVAGLLALLAIFIASRPADFHVERSVTIAAPAEAAFTQVNDF